MKHVYSDLRKLGFENVPYTDDSYLQGNSFAKCWENVKETVQKLQSLRFIIHQEKSVFIPSQGFVLNSNTMTVRLTREKTECLKQACLQLVTLKK